MWFSISWAVPQMQYFFCLGGGGAVAMGPMSRTGWLVKLTMRV